MASGDHEPGEEQLLHCRSLQRPRRVDVERTSDLAHVAADVLPAVTSATGSRSLAVFDSFYRSGSLVFGGGHVVLPLLRAEVVPKGWLTDDQFLAGYGAAQALPGPMFAFSAYLGAANHRRGPREQGRRRRAGRVRAPRALEGAAVARRDWDGGGRPVGVACVTADGDALADQGRAEARDAPLSRPWGPGDEVVRTVAGLLGDDRCSVDTVARYGGEEFAVLRVGSDPAAAMIMLRDAAAAEPTALCLLPAAAWRAAPPARR